MMKVENIFPNNLLQKQICQECYQFLSVPPVVINAQKESICGRCVISLIPGQYTISLFNEVASRFQFKCSNYLNGCNETLPFGKIESHEAACPHHQIQECFFCSFSGNLAQILHHSLKEHADNTYLDEPINFLLSDSIFSKTIILFLNDTDMVLAILEATNDLIQFKFKLVTNGNETSINQYELKISKHDDDPVKVVIHSDYSFFSKNLWNVFEKSKQELKQLFGPVAQLNIRISFDRITLEQKEMQLHKRILSLRKDEKHFYDLKAGFDRKQNKLIEDQTCHQSAMEIIKIMSYNLFMCPNCNKHCFDAIYFCPKMHRYCKDCLTNFCTKCSALREFKRFNSMENFMVTCDWPGCSKQLPLKMFLQHKVSCARRPYKCPLQDCKEVVYSADQLVEHWHCTVPGLMVDNEVLCQGYENVEYYLFAGSDLYHIIVNFNATRIEVLVEEINVLWDNAEVKCQGFTIASHAWQDIQFSPFCGRKKIDTGNKYIRKLKIWLSSASDL